MKKLRYYKTKGYRKIPGWLDRGAVEMICALSNAQLSMAIKGHVGEIGVYRGRLFILLSLLRREKEKALAADLFDLCKDPHSIDDKSILLKNVENHGDPRDVIVVKENSLSLSPQHIESMAGGKFRLFSVDAAHEKENVLNDLEIAENVLTEGGILIHDDFFNEMWPDVSVATINYFSGPRNIIPFAIGGNKIMFSHPSFSERYKESLRNLPAKIYERKFMGHDVLCMDFKTSSLERYISSHPFWLKIRGTPLGRSAIDLRNRVLQR